MMEQKPRGIVFRETMTGGVMLGEDDYRRGEARASVTGDILAMHATVTIPDLERFIQDPEHHGELEGSIDYPPFGNNLPGTSGRFNLFSPAQEPATKLMIYELGFQLAGEPYYLAGKKVVRDDPGFDMWSDTTSLYTSLHKGDDAHGEIIGAGVLRLGVTDLLKLTASMEVTGTEAAVEKVQTLSHFGRFFLGELWDSYGAVME